jgi:hypothetical protein
MEQVLERMLLPDFKAAQVLPDVNEVPQVLRIGQQQQGVNMIGEFFKDRHHTGLKVGRPTAHVTVPEGLVPRFFIFF